MEHSRRKLLRMGAGIFSLAAVGLGIGYAQIPASQQGTGKEENDGLPAKPLTRSILEANEKDIKKNVEKLYQLASDLKEQVEKTDSAKVLSLTLVRKAEEIEKLARSIKERAKG